MTNEPPFGFGFGPSDRDPDRDPDREPDQNPFGFGAGFPGLPGGMPGMPGMGRGKKAKGKAVAPKKAKGGRSGNPAKRAIEQRQWEARQAGEGGVPDLPEDFQLPDELKGLLPPGSR